MVMLSKLIILASLVATATATVKVDAFAFSL